MKRQGACSEDDVLFLVHRFLLEQGLYEAATYLETALPSIFKICVVEFFVHYGKWMRAEEYISRFGFTAEDDLILMEYIYELRKQKFLEALAKRNTAEAGRIFKNDFVSVEVPADRLQKEMKEIQDFVKLTPSSKVDHAIARKRGALMQKLKTMISKESLFEDDYLHRHLQTSSLWQLVDKRHILGGLKLSPTGVDHWRRSKSYLHEYVKRFRNQEPGGVSPHRFADVFLHARMRVSPGQTRNRNFVPAFPISDIVSCYDLTLQILPTNAKMENERVKFLAYANSGKVLVALLSNGYHTIWNLPHEEDDHSRMVATTHGAELVEPDPVRSMVNNLASDESGEINMSCAAFSKDDSFLLSSSGGTLSLFDAATFQEKVAFVPPRAASWFTLLNNDTLAAIGKHDFTIEIYDVGSGRRLDVNLKGHRRRITGLCYSSTTRSLVSSDAGAEIIIWSTDDWKLRARKSLDLPEDRSYAANSKTEVEFHKDGKHVLVAHESQLAMFESAALQIETFQWFAKPFSAPINQAKFSCDCRFIYSTFLDGSIRVFLLDVGCKQVQSLCRITASAYIPRYRRPDFHHFPTTLAAHPADPHRIAIGFTDGQVYILEPLSQTGNWIDSETILLEQANSASSSTSNFL